VPNCSFQLSQSCPYSCDDSHNWIHANDNKLNWSIKNKHLSKLSLGLYASPYHGAGDWVTYINNLFLKSPSTSTEFETKLHGNISVSKKNYSCHKKLNIFWLLKNNIHASLVNFFVNKCVKNIFCYCVTLQSSVWHIKLRFCIKLIWIF
jgi:hypothetical protein